MKFLAHHAIIRKSYAFALVRNELLPFSFSDPIHFRSSANFFQNMTCSITHIKRPDSSDIIGLASISVTIMIGLSAQLSDHNDSPRRHR